MSAFAPSLVTASAMIILALGLIHVLYTFQGKMLHPRDAGLEARLKEVSPVISRETTMWKAWIGFNASHSLGAMLFGVVYAHLALVHFALLRASPFLLAVGAALLISYAWLARRYWFSVPFRGIVLALLLYLAGAAVSLT